MRRNGYVLVTALIFLVVLTLVAVTALRSSGLELHMSSNNALRTESFESSESPRLIVGDLVDASQTQRGWPVSIGGTVPDAMFNHPIPSGISIIGASGVPTTWDGNGDESGNCTTPFLKADGTPCTLRTDATYSRNLATGSQSAFTVRSDLSVFRLRTGAGAGCSVATASGTKGAGKNAVGACMRIYYYVGSVGRDAAPNAADAESQTQTGAMYRYVIRNP